MTNSRDPKDIIDRNRVEKIRQEIDEEKNRDTIDRASLEKLREKHRKEEEISDREENDVMTDENNDESSVESERESSDEDQSFLKDEEQVQEQEDEEESDDDEDKITDKGKVRNFFSDVWGYVKQHKVATALTIGGLVLGGLMIVGGVVLIATSPVTFGGGAAVGAPLLGIGGGLAGGMVLIAGGAIATAVGGSFLFWGVKKERRGNKLQRIFQRSQKSPDAPLDKKADKGKSKNHDNKEIHNETGIFRRLRKKSEPEKRVKFSGEVEIREAMDEVGLSSSKKTKQQAKVKKPKKSGDFFGEKNSKKISKGRRNTIKRKEEDSEGEGNKKGL